MGRASNDPIGDLLDDIMSGKNSGGSAGSSGRKQANPLDEIFGQEQPGTGAQPGQPGLPDMPNAQEQGSGGLPSFPGGGHAGGGSILDILGGILGGGQPGGTQQQAPQQMPGGIEDILGGILGGGQPGGTQQQAPQQMPGGGIEDILGGILGGGRPGGTQQQAPQQMPGGGIEDILGGILGGGMPGGNIAGNPILAPIVNGISKKLGLPPAIVAIGLSLILGKLMSKGSQAQTQPGQQRGPGVPEKSRQPGNLDLDDILDRMRKEGVDRAAIDNSGVVNEVAQETGLGQQDAGQLIEEIIGALGEEGSAKPMPKQSGRGAQGHGGLKDILDTW